MEQQNRVLSFSELEQNYENLLGAFMLHCDEIDLTRKANRFLIRAYLMPYVEKESAKKKVFLNDSDEKIDQLENMVAIQEKWLQESRERIESLEKQIELLKQPTFYLSEHGTGTAKN